MDSDHGSGSGSSKHSRTHPQVVDGSESNKLLKIDTEEEVEKREIDTNSEIHLGAKNLSSSSSSSSSSNSSLEDFFQVTFPSKPDEDIQIASKEDDNDVTSNGSTLFTSTSQVSDLTHESALLNLSPAQSPPPLQVMEHSGDGDYDPDRIPASIFSSKPSSPLEWSTASNESLFSIHVGNNSFSKDQFIMLGGNMSGELTKSGELLLFSPTPPVKIVEVDRKSLDKGPQNFEPSIVTCESKMDDTKENAVYPQNDVKIVHRAVSKLSSSNSKQSDVSGGSTHSFEFPILADGMESGLLKKENSEKQVDDKAKAVPASKWTMNCNCFSCFSWCHCPRCTCCC